MKTEVIMKRKLFGCEISQKSKSEFFSATDLERAGNLFRLSNGTPQFSLSSYFGTVSYKEFEKELIAKYGEVKINSRGKNQHTWVHPLIFIDIALNVSPKIKIEAYEWLFDNLIKYRNESGLSYKKMCGTLYAKTKSPSTFYKDIEKVAENIKLACDVNDWNNANEQQLQKRDKIQDNISLLAEVLNDINAAVRIAIAQAIN